MSNLTREMLIGHNVKIGDVYYQIISKDLMIYKKDVSLSSGSTSVEKFKDDLMPNREYLYQVLKIAVDGFLQMQLQFPEGVPHWSPHQISQYIDFKVAPYPKGIKAEIWIENPNYMSLAVYNPKSYTVEGTFWFFGFKYTVRQLVTPPDTFYEATDYATGGGGG